MPGGPGGFGGAGRGPSAGPNMGFGGFDFSDFAKGAGYAGSRPHPADAGESSSFHDLFSQWFGRQHEPQATPPEEGTDLEYGPSIDFWQASRGPQVQLKVNGQEAGSTCNGTGARAGA